MLILDALLSLHLMGAASQSAPQASPPRNSGSITALAQSVKSVVAETAESENLICGLFLQVDALELNTENQIQGCQINSSGHKGIIGHGFLGSGE